MSKQTVSRKFKSLLEQYDAQAFHLAAENFRDHIVNATRSLNSSDWKSAITSVLSI